MHRNAGLSLLEHLNRRSDPFAFYLFKEHRSREASGLLLHGLKQERYVHDYPSLKKALKQLPRQLGQGRTMAITLDYEAGYGFEKQLSALNNASGPIAWFGAFNQAATCTWSQVKAWMKKSVQQYQRWPAYWLSRVQPQLTYAVYRRQLDRIHEAIAAGRTYQVNFTFPWHAHFAGNELAFFLDLFQAQPVGYAAMIRRQKDVILSLSPELFFSKKDDGIMVRPMKGTAPRGRTLEEDRCLKTALAGSEKNRAENIMIVDLLRNDLGRLCRIGSVHTKHLFQVESYRTLFQMTSTVQGELRPNTSWLDLFGALFPCGSVTGAPKVETMSLIHSLEQQPRGLYTGALGYILPDGSAQFNVPIRTLQLQPQNGCLTCGLGSGIVADSRAKAEWQECGIKGRFLRDCVKNYELIETMLWKPGLGIELLNRHLKRLQQSADFFRIPFFEQRLRQRIKRLVRRLDPQRSHRLRLLLDSHGQATLTTTPFTPEPGRSPGYIRLASKRVHSSNLFLYHKTTNRNFYHYFTRRAQAQGLADYIFCNEQGKLTEGTVTNLFVVKNKAWLTPPVSDGLLPGVMRQVVMAGHKAGEKSLTVEDLIKADHIYLTNAVRGLREVNLLRP